MENKENTWEGLLLRISKRFNVLADFNFVLFLIGIQERGTGLVKYTKEEKMDLINLARCILFEAKGFYKRSGVDESGWPIFETINEIKDIPSLERESLLKDAMIEYYNNKL